MSDTKLTPYKGHDVLSATVAIRRTGDGLSKAMEVDPVELELGSTVTVVLECEVEKHRYDPIDDGGGALQLVNMLKAGRATIIDRDVVQTALDEQQRRIEEAQGVQRLPLDGDGDGDGEQVLSSVIGSAEDEISALNEAADEAGLE